MTRIRQAALACLGYLHKEEALLEEAIKQAEDLYDALNGRNWGCLSELFQRHAELGQKAGQLAIEREEIRKRLGSLLGVAPEHVTIGSFLPEVPADLQLALQSAKERLMQMCNELKEKNYRNGLVIHGALQVFNRMLMVMTGQSPSETYTRSGSVEAMDTRPLFEARG